MTAIETYFMNLWDFCDILPHQPLVNIDDDAFPAFIETPLQNNIEVPMIFAPYFTKIYRLHHNNYDKVAFNLVSGRDNIERRVVSHKTVSTILKSFYNASNTDVRLAHIVTDKGIHYYGCTGLILDANYNPLLIATGKFCVKENGTLTVREPLCRVSYRVFENSSELLEKTIIKWALPYYANTKVICSVRFGREISNEYVKVIIDNYDYMVTKPVKPSLIETSPTYVNSIISSSYNRRRILW
jgi:hypothetical protein